LHRGPFAEKVCEGVVQGHGVADADGIGDGPVQVEGEVTDGQENGDGEDRQGHLPEAGVFIRDAV
jgi:hypothetical protein